MRVCPQKLYLALAGEVGAELAVGAFGDVDFDVFEGDVGGVFEGGAGYAGGVIDVGFAVEIDGDVIALEDEDGFGEFRAAVANEVHGPFEGDGEYLGVDGRVSD